MVTQLNLSVRGAEPEDRQKLANLIHFEVYVHRHLDWRSPLDWLGRHPYLVGEQNGAILAALACPPDPERVAWIRLFAVSGGLSLENAWHALWAETQALFTQREKQVEVAAIPLQGWFQSLLEESGFTQTHRVVMLHWERGRRSPEPLSGSVIIRPMNFGDLEAVHQIDASAFSPVWQNSLESLQLAFQQAAVATVAEKDGNLAGYQISTATPLGGHLARLAVSPASQGSGIGYSLVWDVISQFERRGAHSVTVNTQQDNLVSLALYRKAGFRRTGEEYPVYQYTP